MSTAKNEAELRQICEAVQVISMRVGEFIRQERKKFRLADVESKGAGNLVSYVDKQAEKMFVEALRTILPEAGFIAEEDNQLQRGEKYNWVIDPLDGTTNFIHGVPCFATSVGLMQEEHVVAGVIYEINLDECFYAWKNGGAWLNGERIHVSKTEKLQEALLGTGFPYNDSGVHEKYIRLFSDLQQKTRGLRRPGSAATDIAWVAAGRFDAFYEYGLHAWDMAAGVILVQEAGGLVTDFAGEENFMKNSRIICSNKQIHAELLGKIQEYFK
ncbi:MAG TPA: inositol monophosphatase family protein [Bacteroidia bacterium]|nr:inositol monophosphatase family protein [Bacteroidia bacterium]